VHLDGDSYGTSQQQQAHRERLRDVFRRIVDLALADDVHLVLIAGDLFDHNRVADDTVAFVQAELRRFRRPVVILPGNHDSLYANSLHDRHDLADGANHVHVIRKLQGQVIEFPELDLMVWGRAMEEHEREFRPLAHVPPRDEARWCLAMGHGFFYETRQPPERSSPIFADEIRDSGWDYVALGHQHVQTDVSQGSVVAYYAGAPMDGSVLRVDFSEEDGVRVAPRRLA
jgi:DNA repair exonuclease SbcCD nuclease subunit